MTKRRTLLGLVGAAAMALALPASQATAQDVTLTLHEFLPSQATIPSQISAPWAKSIEEASGERIKFDIYSG